MSIKKTATSHSQLPNAPLVEVVFELHWKLAEDKSAPKQFWTDPSYPFLTRSFTNNATKHGYNKVVDVGKGGLLTAYSVGLRFYKGEGQSFPLWQIGPGLFASNESAAYDWNTYKNQTLDGVKVLLSSYPKIKDFGLVPSKLELRYIDSFDISPQEPMTFLNEKTSLDLVLSPFLTKKSLGMPLYNLKFNLPTSRKDTNFRIEIVSGSVEGKKTVLLTSRVISNLENIKIGKSDISRITYIEKWLEFAHSLTSSFFKDFIDESLMEEFRRGTNAHVK